MSATRTTRRTRVRTWSVVLGVGVLAVGGALVVRGAREPAAAPRTAAPSPVHLQPASGEVALVIDSAALHEADVATRPLGPASAASDALQGGAIQLTGELVVDPDRVTAIRSAVPGRLTAAGSRWPALGDRIAAGAVLAQVSDARPLAAPRSGTVTRVGAQPGELVQAGQELLQLSDVTQPIARMVWRADAPSPPATLLIAPLVAPMSGVGGGNGAATARASARLIRLAPDVDSLTRAPVYLYRLTRGWSGARAGLPVTATVSGPRVPSSDRSTSPAGATTAGANTTLLVPLDAVLQWQGLAWVFVARGPGRFVRVRVDTGRAVPGGWLVPAAAPHTPNALAAGDGVVVRGAQQLLSAEFRSTVAASAGAAAGTGDPDDE